MVMELVTLGSLDKLLLLFGEFLRTSAKLSMCEQVCSAMAELSAEGVLHRDLAARNVLVASLDPVHVKVRGMAGGVKAHEVFLIVAHTPLVLRVNAPRVAHSCIHPFGTQGVWHAAQQTCTAVAAGRFMAAYVQMCAVACSRGDAQYLMLTGTYINAICW
jgi:serine/threonine protein kinase